MRGQSGPPVEVEGLEKRHPKAPVNAVDGVTFTVAQGEVFGLLGPNGAGKATTIGVLTIGVLTTRVKLTGGVARVGGIDVSRDPVRRGRSWPWCRSARTSTGRSRSART